MEAVLFVGLQASGKSSFYRRRFFDTHVRISLDLLRTRYRERLILKACLETQQRFAVDNTNPTRAERLVYLEPAKAAGYRVVGFYFRSSVQECLRRNAERHDRGRVPEVAIPATAKKLERPSFDEGFDELFHVTASGGEFVVEEWPAEPADQDTVNE